MSEQKTVKKTSSRPAETEQAQAEGPGGGPSPLLEQAAGWAGVAREANANCHTDVEAEKQYERRKNRSGQ